MEGFTLLMKLADDTFDFDHECWTTEALYNHMDEDELKPACAKYEAFNDLKVQEIMLVDESGRYTVLRLPKRMTLLELFQ